jgi:hypothetical protein
MIRPGIMPWSKLDEIRPAEGVGLRMFYGLLFGVLLSIPMWVVVVLLIIWLAR